MGIEPNVSQIPEVAFFRIKLILLPKLLFCNLKNWQFGWSAAEPGNLLLSDVSDEFVPNFQKVHGRTF